MLSFKEFSAVNRRERANVNQTTTKESNKISVQQSSANIISTIGPLLEMIPTQQIILTVILLDTSLMFLLTGLQLISVEGILYDKHLSQNTIYQLMLQFCQLLSTFFLYILVFEIVLIFSVFNFRALFHLGYLIDLLVISCQVYMHVRYANGILRVLNIFRVWRVIRLITTMVDEEKVHTEEIQTKLNEKETDIIKLQTNILQLKSQYEREKDAKISIEKLIQGYKEEIDTLNEALRIAAMDIAEIGEDNEFFQEENDDEEGEREDGVVDHDYEEGMKKEERIKNDNIEKNKLSYIRKNNNQFIDNTTSAVMTLVINEDGTYHHTNNR